MRSAILTIVVFLAAFAAAFAQAPAQPPEKLTFDVASIKPFEMPTPGGGRGVFFGRGGGPGTKDPGRVNWAGATLRDLVMTAYDVKRYQVEGPSWTDTERYDIVAKVPAGATKEQVAVMWQNLLADRFGLTFHRVSKEFSVQELVVAKGGPKLKPTEIDPNAPPPAAPGDLPPGPPKRDANGVPKLDRPGMVVMISPGQNGQPVAHMVGLARSMVDLADILGNELNKPVLDKTSLTGKYDFNLEYTPDLAGRGLPLLKGGPDGPPPGAGAAPADSVAEPGSNIASAIQQLGLRLNSAKDKLDVLVIDKANQTPTEN